LPRNPISTDHEAASAILPEFIADPIAGGQAVEALSAAISVTVTAALERLRSPRIRGPFPYPCADDLARSAYLHQLARWARAAALRSARTLGSLGVEEALESARGLTLAADLLAVLENAPSQDLAQAAAFAALEGMELGASRRPPAASSAWVRLRPKHH
jgi:hypothetical protein